MKASTPSFAGDNSLEKRVRQEIEAALRCDDARAAAAHVELAIREAHRQLRLAVRDCQSLLKRTEEMLCRTRQDNTPLR